MEEIKDILICWTIIVIMMTVFGVITIQLILWIIRSENKKLDDKMRKRFNESDD